MQYFSLFFLIVFSVSSNGENFTTSNKLFTASVYTEITKKQEGNFLVSPFSAENVLAFVLSGARGQTAEELRMALHLDNDQTEVESEIKSTLPTLRDNDKYTFKTANKLYVKKNYTLNDNFKKAASEVYFADTDTIDFLDGEAANTMNQWVEDQTDKKITNLIKSDVLDKWTRAILINALYFKANWSNPFFLVNTKRARFYKSENDSVEVPTLHHYRQFYKYYECPHLKAQFLELPFEGGDASMVVVLPNEKEGLPSLEKNLEQVFAPRHEWKLQVINVVLPKFRIESSTDLQPILENLGVGNIFDTQKADLSGVAGVPGDLYLNKVLQKTFVDVNEEGVEAAAATFALIAVPKSMIIGPVENFIADHPFIFYIKIKDFIVFAGRVTDPSNS